MLPWPGLVPGHFFWQVRNPVAKKKKPHLERQGRGTECLRDRPLLTAKMEKMVVREKRFRLIVTRPLKSFESHGYLKQQLVQNPYATSRFLKK